MKRIFVVVAAILLSLVMAGQSFATDATEAINPEAQPVLIYGKSSDGSIAKFSSEPRIQCLNKTVGWIGGGNPVRLYTVTLYSDTVGDLIGLWDMAQPTQTVEFEIAIAANTSSATVNFYGAKFEHGLYISTSDATNSVVGVVYDY